LSFGETDTQEGSYENEIINACSLRYIGRIESVILPNGKTVIGAAPEHFIQKDVAEGCIAPQ